MGRDLDRAKAAVNNPPVIVENLADAKKYICNYPLDKFLGIARPRSFCCPFHADRKPSASIHLAPVTGHQLLTCNGSCRHTWDIIGVVQHRYHVSYLTACKMLAYVLNITVLHIDEVASDYVPKLNENLQLLDNLSAYQSTQHLLAHGYTQISPLTILKYLTEYAIELHENKQDLRDPFGHPIFYISVRELLRRMNGGSGVSGKHSAKLTLLCYLGLLERVPDCDLSPEALERASSPENDYRSGNPERYKNSKGNRISFYRIPYLTPEILANIEEHNAVNWSRWYSISNVSYNKICLTEGQRIADTIYAGRKVRHGITQEIKS